MAPLPLSVLPQTSPKAKLVQPFAGESNSRLASAGADRPPPWTRSVLSHKTSPAPAGSAARNNTTETCLLYPSSLILQPLLAHAVNKLIARAATITTTINESTVCAMLKYLKRCDNICVSLGPKDAL